jgi:tRNA pseudouridine38-40 synthase
MRFRLTVSYRGDGYAGWQRQPRAPSVQATLEAALGDLLGGAVRVTGAGRTDAGVHARGQVVSFSAPAAAAATALTPGALVHGTNFRLPDDVRVLAAAAAPEGFDARRHAAGKEYRYHLRRAAVLSPLDAPFAERVDPRVDVEAMRAAARTLLGRHDFVAFAKTGGGAVTTVRTLSLADWVVDGEALTFRVAGDGFLRGMVRALVGTLLEVGRGRRSVDGFATLLDGAGRGEAGQNAPAHGLVLWRVDYPPEWLVSPTPGQHPGEIPGGGPAAAPAS